MGFIISLLSRSKQKEEAEKKERCQADKSDDSVHHSGSAHYLVPRRTINNCAIPESLIAISSIRYFKRSRSDIRVIRIILQELQSLLKTLAAYIHAIAVSCRVRSEELPYPIADGVPCPCRSRSDVFEGLSIISRDLKF